MSNKKNRNFPNPNKELYNNLKDIRQKFYDSLKK